MVFYFLAGVLYASAFHSNYAILLSQQHHTAREASHKGDIVEGVTPNKPAM